MNIEQKIKDLAKNYADNLKSKMSDRVEEMKGDDKSHYLVYQVLGVSKRPFTRELMANIIMEIVLGNLSKRERVLI